MTNETFTASEEILLENPATGSVATELEWYGDFLSAKERGTLKEEGWPQDFADHNLIEVE